MAIMSASCDQPDLHYGDEPGGPPRCCVPCMKRYLQDRAESYWQDAKALDKADEPTMAVAYRKIADELRRCANAWGAQ